MRQLGVTHALFAPNEGKTAYGGKNICQMKKMQHKLVKKR